MTFDDMFTHTFNLFISLPRRKHRGNLSIINRAFSIYMSVLMLTVLIRLKRPALELLLAED